MKLTKCMFSDPKCRAFGLSNNQIRGSGIINSAGWFNLDGDRLGNGDLTLADMSVIAKEVSDDLFVVLKEIDAKLDMPKHLDHLSPGKDYVCSRAVWMIGRDIGGKGTIIRVRDDIDKAELAKQDGVEYMRVPRKEVYKALNYTPPVKKAKQKDEGSLEAALKEAAQKLKTATSKVSPASPANHPVPAKPAPINTTIPAPPPVKKSSTGLPLKKKMVKKLP